jgi:GTP cyclohydrolase II
MKNPKTRIIAQNGGHGLDIYLDISGRRHYLTTHRPNGLLYLWLKDGKTIGELRRAKPAYTRSEQKTYHYAQHLAKLAEDYFKYDLAA